MVDWSGGKGSFGSWTYSQGSRLLMMIMVMMVVMMMMISLIISLMITFMFSLMISLITCHCWKLSPQNLCSPPAFQVLPCLA